MSESKKTLGELLEEGVFDEPLRAIPLTEEEKGYMEKVNEGIRKSIVEERKESGGVIVPTSNCCDAKIKYTSGGVIGEYCSDCGKEVKEFLYK